MAEVAAGQPFYENTWLATGSILLLLVILGAMLMLLAMVTPRTARWIRRAPKLLRWITAIAACLVALIAFSLLLPLRNFSAPPSPRPSPQDLFQQHLTQDEQALDKGVLTYPALPTLKADLPTTLTVIVTDLGKHPNGSM